VHDPESIANIFKQTSLNMCEWNVEKHCGNMVTNKQTSLKCANEAVTHWGVCVRMLRSRRCRRAVAEVQGIHEQPHLRKPDRNRSAGGGRARPGVTRSCAWARSGVTRACPGTRPAFAAFASRSFAHLAGDFNCTQMQLGRKIKRSKLERTKNAAVDHNMRMNKKTDQ
jgi:hypothetical protein